MNGKSGNVNNICNQLYPDRLNIPGSEVLCIFDADQVSPLPYPSGVWRLGDTLPLASVAYQNDL